MFAVLVLPTQSMILSWFTDPVEGRPELVRSAQLRTVQTLGMATGTFALLCAVVVVLMISRPGSSTGA